MVIEFALYRVDFAAKYICTGAKCHITGNAQMARCHPSMYVAVA